jgi:hypothetical protein
MSVTMNPTIVANITRIERSLNLIMLTAPVKKAAIPEIPAHIPGMARYRFIGSLGFCPERTKSITVRKNKKQAAINPPAHLPSFVFGIIYLLIKQIRISFSAPLAE